MEQNKNQNKLYRYSIFYSVIILFAFVLVYILFSSTMNLNIRRVILVPILLVIFFMTNGFLLYLLKKVFILNRKHEKIELERLKYKYLENDLKMYRQHRHDMKNHLTVIYELVQNSKYDDLKEYTKQYIDTTSKKLRQINTGADEIDVLIYSKIDRAKEYHIETDYHCMTQLEISHHSIIDVVSILSNLLDNAIDANKRITSTNDRMISINISEDQLDYVLVVTNAFIQQVNPSNFTKDGFTTKSDARNHGLGLGIIDKIVAKYNGNVNIEIFNEIFYQVKIEIPKHTL